MKNIMLNKFTQGERKDPVTMELVYTDKKEIAAIHMFTKGGVFSYNRSGKDYIPTGDSINWDASWFEEY